MLLTCLSSKISAYLFKINKFPMFPWHRQKPACNPSSINLFLATEEIEQLQEGGYDDTSVNSEKAAPVTEVPETPSMEEPKEVQP